MEITGLNIYPIKGCRGVPVAVAEVDRLGLVGDRRLMLVDSEGRFISQRENSRLATVVPGLTNGDLRMDAPSLSTLVHHVNLDAPSREVQVWGDTVITAADQGDVAAEWLGAAIGEPCRLVAWGPRSRNIVDQEYAPRADAETAFTDGYPITVALQESLDDLNRRLAEPVPMTRFRPSIVVSGARAWSEDDWMAMKLGEIDCDAVKPCARCSVTTTDQFTGARSATQEPLRTLAGFRTIQGLGAIFAQNVVPRSTGVLHVGDAVEVM